MAFSTGPVPTASASGGSTLGVLLLLGFTAGIGYESYSMSPPPPPPLDPSRRVLEQDCTQPIVDRSANLRCR